MEDSEEPSPAQEQAVATLRAIAAASGGDLVYDTGSSRLADGWLDVRVWLAGGQFPQSGTGAQLDEWEPVDIMIPQDFPLAAPAAHAGHYGFAGQPHVLWGNGLCLYPSSSDWDPAAGITGFLRRLASFYAKLALGTFEDPQVPVHPPVAYGVPRAGCAVVAADLRPQDRTRRDAFVRWAVGVRRNRERIDIVEWLGFPGRPGADGELAAPLTAELRQARSRSGEPEAFLVPAVVLPEPIAFEYPLFVSDLLEALEHAGVSAGYVLYSVYCAMFANETLGGAAARRDTFVIVRSPADKRFTTADAPAYFAVWRLAPDDTAAVSLEGSGEEAESRMGQWLGEGVISWAWVYDTRPDAVMRRDTGRPAGRVAGRRVLILGCGALGAPIAEHCVRAGAAVVDVVDNGYVHPGILVRQPYDDCDIGFPKAERLAARLSRISPATTVGGMAGDALSFCFPRRPWSLIYDLVIDATASKPVAAAIEQSKRAMPDGWPDLVTVGLSRSARYGAAAVAPRGTRGAGTDLMRHLALETCGRADLQDVYGEFFPVPGEQPVFVPDGCSSPTFVGSATDVAALAAQMLDAALGSVAGIVRVSAAGESAYFPRERSLSIVRLGTPLASSLRSPA